MNRGGGTLHAYYAAGARPAAGAGKGHDDAEKQRRVLLDEGEVRAALAKGEFREVKWTATIALALMLPRAE